MNKVIIDTDLGTDIDDAMAISLAMKSSEIEIVGVTTVYGDSKYRAQLATRLISLGGCNFDVYAGIDKPLLGKRSIFMAGNEGEGAQEDLDYQFNDIHAVDFLIEEVMSNPGEITIVAIGPLTNLAVAMIKEPKFATNIKELIIMGGSVRLGANSLNPMIRAEEHNIVCDPESAEIVLSSKANIYMVGLDVTMMLNIGAMEYKLLKGSDSKLNNLLGDMLADWMVFVKKTFGDEKTYMHDPLALVCSFNKSFIKFEPMDIEVRYTDKERTGQTIGKLNPNSNIKVALEVENKEFIDFLFKRLLGE